MLKRMALGLVGGILLLGGSVASATTCEGKLIELQTGGYLLSGKTDAFGAVGVIIFSQSHQERQRFLLVTDQAQREDGTLPAARAAWFDGLAEFRVDLDGVYQFVFVDKKGRTLCVVPVTLTRGVPMLRLLADDGEDVDAGIASLDEALAAAAQRGREAMASMASADR